MLKTPGVMPARGGARAVLEAQPYNGGVASLPIGEGDLPDAGGDDVDWR